MPSRSETRCTDLSSNNNQIASAAADSTRSPWNPETAAAPPGGGPWTAPRFWELGVCFWCKMITAHITTFRGYASRSNQTILWLAATLLWRKSRPSADRHRERCKTAGENKQGELHLPPPRTEACRCGTPSSTYSLGDGDGNTEEGARCPASVSSATLQVSYLIESICPMKRGQWVPRAMPTYVCAPQVRSTGDSSKGGKFTLP